MKSIRLKNFRLSMPLLVKELAEQSSRVRTYRLRQIFAVLLYLPAMVMLLTNNRRMEMYATMGMGAAMANTALGREMCMTLMMTLQIATYLFLPALTATAIASEKENGSLQLLFLTDLKPWETILQKYLGRLIPFLTLALLALPLFAVGYAYGGLSTDLVLCMAYGILITMLQVAAIALFCSARCATTTAAIVSSYFLGAAFYFTPYLLAIFLQETYHNYYNESYDFLLSWFPTYVLFEHIDKSGNMLVASIPVLITTVIFLLLARLSLVRSVFSPRRSVVSVFRRMDVVYTAWNRHLGNRTYFEDHATLPADRPIAWREMHKRGLGRRHHLVRLLLILVIPLVFVMLVAFIQPNEGVYVTIASVVWLICGMILVTAASSSIAVERSNQTLEVLLSTPMDTQGIIKEKLASLRRLAFVLGIPLLILIVPAAGGMTDLYWLPGRQHYWLFYIPATIIGLRYLLWTGFACGLFIRNKTTAVITAITMAIFLFAGLPLLLGFLIFEIMRIHDGWPFNMLFLLSPGLPILGSLLPQAWREFFRDWETGAWFAWYVVAISSLSFTRGQCLKRASKILRSE